MKSINELLKLLFKELIENYPNIRKLKSEKLDYYNEFLDNIPILLAGILQQSMEKNFNEWKNEKWIDDCLINKIKTHDNILTFFGIIISGKYETTKQWTDPFSFEIELNFEDNTFKNYTLLFCDMHFNELDYIEFRNNKDYWKPINRNWKYSITGNLDDSNMFND